MIHTKEDFFNKLAAQIKETYFSEVQYYRDNKNCIDAHYAIELFNNGCLTYRKLIGRLAKSCNDSTSKINSIVSNYIVSFGQYKYKPKK